LHFGGGVMKGGVCLFGLISDKQCFLICLLHL